MPIKFRPLAFYSIALAAVAACAPDLDALSTDFAGGAGGTGGSTGGTSATGGSDSGSGGTEMPGTGGSDPIGGDGGDSGDSGTGGSVGGSAGKGGSSGTGGSSTAASCMNESTDANESDTDCGGTSDCKRCPLTSVCSRNADCASAYCKNRRCAQATCADGSKNQDETAIDCGGTCAPELACDDGQACRIDDDCESEFCSDEVCTDHCTSDRREANETDKDCGGPDCDPCTTGKRCTQQEDCESKVCNNNQCQAATCSDEIRNQDESDQDCGGVCSQEEKACENGLRCNTGSDCETYVCNSSGRCANDIEILADAVIDYFEDGNSILPATGGRAGNWYVYGDGSGLASGGTEAIPGKRGAQSSFAFHTSGGDFTVWGSGMGVDLNNSGGGQVSKEPYDASAYSGVTFWARAATAMSITAVFPDGNTDAAGANGPDPNPTPCVVCDHHWTAGVAITPTWKRYTVLFADLALEPSGDPIPTAPDPAHLVSIQFRVPSGTTYDFWIDDVAFVE